jgi:hypothetical protein
VTDAYRTGFRRDRRSRDDGKNRAAHGSVGPLGVAEGKGEGDGKADADGDCAWAAATTVPDPVARMNVKAVNLTACKADAIGSSARSFKTVAANRSVPTVATRALFMRGAWR